MDTGAALSLNEYARHLFNGHSAFQRQTCMPNRNPCFLLEIDFVHDLLIVRLANAANADVDEMLMNMHFGSIEQFARCKKDKATNRKLGE